METNEIYVRISGRFPVRKEIKLGEDVEMTLKMGCVKVENKDNQDGSMDIISILKILEVKE